MTLIFTGRNAGIKITFVGFLKRIFWILCTVIFGREEVAPISYSLPKLKISGDHLENFGPENPQKPHNNLENARRNYFRSLLKNPLVENCETYNVNATLWSISVF